MTKTCIKCNTEKVLELFAKGKQYKDGRRNLCKKCHSEYVSDWQKRNPEKYAANKKKQSYTKANWKRHRIGEQVFNQLMALHDGKCHLCQVNPATDIDHDHKCCPKRFSCGKCVRGVLCGGCNKAMGAFKDDITVFKRIITYLSK